MPRPLGDIEVDSVYLEPAKWDDVRIPGASFALPAANNPSFSQVLTDGAGSVGVFGLRFSPLARNDAFFNMELPHHYKQGSNIQAHLHWFAPDANAGNVVWEFEYIIANRIGGIYGNTTLVTPVTLAVPGVANRLIPSQLAIIPGATLLISAILFGRISRLGADGADTYASDAVVALVDFHYEIDSIGSQSIQLKTT
jgi:hypothetical protein